MHARADSLFFFVSSPLCFVSRRRLPCIVARWLPKLRDGVAFGMEHPDIVELEEERWALQMSSLKV